MLNRKAFTLAEVLITLGIIGVIAALTIPTLLQDVQTQSTVSAVKKAYFVLSQAYASAVKDNGTIDTWTLSAYPDPVGAETILSMLAPYLNITKNCGRNPGCFPSQSYKYISNTGSDAEDSKLGQAKAQLADGSLIAIYSYGSGNCDNNGYTASLQSICGEIYVDINGFKSPNTWGIDYFSFYITKNGIVPIGTKLDSYNWFDNDCKDTTTSSGWGCTAWVLQNQNLDYLKCGPSLSWDGPTKCN